MFCFFMDNAIRREATEPKGSKLKTQLLCVCLGVVCQELIGNTMAGTLLLDPCEALKTIFIDAHQILPDGSSQFSIFS